MCCRFELRGALSPIFVGVERFPVERTIEEEVQFAIDHRIGFRIDGKLGLFGPYALAQ